MIPSSVTGIAWRSRALPLLVAILVLTVARPLRAADPSSLTEDQIKAGFLFNFMRFVDWPAKDYETSTSSITVCIIGETPVTPLLIEAAKDKLIEGRSVLVKHVKTNEDFRGCHLLFIASNESSKEPVIFSKLAGANVLTVGEDPGFALAGGVLNFLTQDNRVKLELNLDAATRANLKISAKLIAVSHLVHDSHSGRRD
jgi:hypothetical protein